MKRCVLGAAIALVFLTHAAFTGPVDPASNRAADRVAAPPLPRSATIGETTIVLDDVIDRRSRELGDPPPPDSDRRVVHDARRGIRRITVELAMLGREPGDASTLAGFHAIRLDATMRSIDRLLESIARPGTLVGEPPATLPEHDRATAITRLRAFNRTSLDLLRRSDTGTVEGLDRTLATILAPLRDIFGLLRGHPLQSRWPSGPESPVAEGPTATDASDPPIDVRVMAMLDAFRIDPPDASFDVTILEPLLSTIPFDPNAPESTATWRRAADVLDCLGEARDDERPLATQTLRSVRRDAVADRRKALRRLQRSLATSADATTPDLRDEDLLDLRRATSTLRAVRRLDELATGLSSMHPAATRKAERIVGSWARGLSDPRERVRMLDSIDRLVGDLDRYSAIDFERRLRDPDPSTIELVGGRTLELSDRIATTRRGWVDAVTNGDAEGPAIDAMERIARLGTLLENLIPLIPTDDIAILDLDRSDRWGGWYVDAKTLGWSARTLLPGARLVVGTAIAGDSDRFERELTTLESQSPLVRLAAEVARRTEDTMATLPGGGIATIASSSIPPTPSAWGLKQRIALAAACLGMAELVAIQADSGKDAPDGMMRRDDLAGAVAAACEALLAELKTDAPVGKEIRP